MLKTEFPVPLLSVKNQKVVRIVKFNIEGINNLYSENKIYQKGQNFIFHGITVSKSRRLNIDHFLLSRFQLTLFFI